MTDLKALGSRAVVVGVSTYHSDDLSDVPAIPDTVSDLRQALIDRCGMARERVRLLADPGDARELESALVWEAQRTSGVLLVYYVGHGLIGPRGDLYLAVGRTDPAPGQLGLTAISYDGIRRQLTEQSPAQAIVVILDCCFSGLARTPDGGVDRGLAMLTGLEGGLLITSSAREEHALAPEGDRYTAFTGQLLELLSQGAPDGPAELTFRDAYRYLGRKLEYRDLPRPRWLSAGVADDIVLAANPARQEPQVPATGAASASPPPTPSGAASLPTIPLTSVPAATGAPVPATSGTPAANGAATATMATVSGATISRAAVSRPPGAGSGTAGDATGNRRLPVRVIAGIAVAAAIVAGALIALPTWLSHGGSSSSRPPSTSPPQSPTHPATTSPPAIACATGSLQLIGSTAFGPIAQAAADEYMSQCAHTSITVNPENITYDSAYGLSHVQQAVQQKSGQAGSMIAMYDGLPTAPYTAGLNAHPVGALIFSVVAHTGLFSGSTISVPELKKIFAGTGQQGVVGVGRLAGSGSRLNLFRRVLNEQQPGNPYRDNCPPATGRPSSIAQCTEGTTAGVLNFVNGTPNAIGYAEIYGLLSSDPEVSVLSIDGAGPTKANVLNGSYSYWTIEHLYTAPQPTPLASDFLNFLTDNYFESVSSGVIPCSQDPGKKLEPDC